MRSAVMQKLEGKNAEGPAMLGIQVRSTPVTLRRSDDLGKDSEELTNTVR